VTRLNRYVGFLAHLLRRLSAVVREGRMPRRPGEVALRLRASFRAFEGAAPRAAAVGRLEMPRPRVPGVARLLFISHTLNVEGAPISQLCLASALDPRRYEIGVLAPEDGPLRERYEAAGIRVGLTKVLRGIHTEAAYLERVSELARWVRQTGFDLVFCNTLVSFWGVSVAREARLPSVWCIRESVDWRTYFSYLAPPIARQGLACLGRADRLVYVADATRRLFPEPRPPARAQTIYNGVDVAAIEVFKQERSREEVRASRGLKDHERVVSVIGTTCQRKGQLDFLRAAARLRQRRDAAALHFYVVGARRGEYLDRLQRFVAKEGLDSVVFVPETTNVFEHYRLSDLVVCPSYEESLPRIILEAMAFELPIVSTDVFGIPEAIEDGRSGLLVRPGDVEGLAAGIDRLLDDPLLGRRLAANARVILLSRFTVEQMAAEYDGLFQECLG
jgi:O-antigen biosynthesis protein